MDRLESTFEVRLFDYYDQMCQWNMLWEQYDEFVKNFVAKFFRGQGEVRSGAVQGLLDEPLENMPLYINEWEGYAVIAKWRMEIAK